MFFRLCLCFFSIVYRATVFFFVFLSLKFISVALATLINLGSKNKNKFVKFPENLNPLNIKRKAHRKIKKSKL